MRYECFKEPETVDFYVNEALAVHNQLSEYSDFPLILHGSVGRHVADPYHFQLRRNRADHGKLDIDIAILGNLTDEQYQKIFNYSKMIQNHLVQIDLTVIDPHQLEQTFLGIKTTEILGISAEDEESNAYVPDILGQLAIITGQKRYRRKDAYTLLSHFKLLTGMNNGDRRTAMIRDCIRRYLFSSKFIHDITKGSYHLLLPHKIRQRVGISRVLRIEDNDIKRSQDFKAKKPIHLF